MKFFIFLLLLSVPAYGANFRISISTDGLVMYEKYEFDGKKYTEIEKKEKLFKESRVSTSTVTNENFVLIPLPRDQILVLMVEIKKMIAQYESISVEFSLLGIPTTEVDLKKSIFQSEYDALRQRYLEQ